MKKFSYFLSLLLLHQLILYGQSDVDSLIFYSDGAAVRGYFHVSQNSNAPTLLFTQGFMETGDIWNLGKTLSEQGINVFRFDFRGCFQSEGKQSLLHSQEDIGAALEFIRSPEMIQKYAIDPGQIIIGGYSYGGHMSLLFATYHPEVRRIISISGGDLGIFGNVVKADPALRKNYSDFFQSIRKPQGPVDFMYDDPISELIENHDYFRILPRIENLKNDDILLTGGLDDVIVSMEEYVLPLYHEFQRVKVQDITCKIYQTGHSYANAQIQLLSDIISWIHKS